MPNKVWFATSNWNNLTRPNSGYYSAPDKQQEWDARNSSKFNGFPFPIFEKNEDNEDFQQWNGITKFRGNPSQYANRAVTVISDNYSYKFTRDQLFKLYWRMKGRKIQLKDLHFNEEVNTYEECDDARTIPQERDYYDYYYYRVDNCSTYTRKSQDSMSYRDKSYNYYFDEESNNIPVLRLYYANHQSLLEDEGRLIPQPDTQRVNYWAEILPNFQVAIDFGEPVLKLGENDYRVAVLCSGCNDLTTPNFYVESTYTEKECSNVCGYKKFTHPWVEDNCQVYSTVRFSAGGTSGLVMVSNKTGNACQGTCVETVACSGTSTLSSSFSGSYNSVIPPNPGVSGPDGYSNCSRTLNSSTVTTHSTNEQGTGCVSTVVNSCSGSNSMSYGGRPPYGGDYIEVTCNGSYGDELNESGQYVCGFQGTYTETNTDTDEVNSYPASACCYTEGTSTQTFSPPATTVETITYSNPVPACSFCEGGSAPSFTMDTLYVKDLPTLANYQFRTISSSETFQASSTSTFRGERRIQRKGKWRITHTPGGKNCYLKLWLRKSTQKRKMKEGFCADLAQWVDDGPKTYIDLPPYEWKGSGNNIGCMGKTGRSYSIKETGPDGPFETTTYVGTNLVSNWHNLIHGPSTDLETPLEDGVSYVSKVYIYKHSFVEGVEPPDPS